MSLQLGAVVKVAIGPLVDHEAVVTGYDWDGVPLLTNASSRTRTTREERLEVVIGRKAYRIEYPSNESPRDVVARAKSLIGTPYDLLTHNCRDVVRHAHKLGPVGKVATAAALALLLFGGAYAVTGGLYLLARGLRGK